MQSVTSCARVPRGFVCVILMFSGQISYFGATIAILVLKNVNDFFGKT